MNRIFVSMSYFSMLVPKACLPQSVNQLAWIPEPSVHHSPQSLLRPLTLCWKQGETGLATPKREERAGRSSGFAAHTFPVSQSPKKRLRLTLEQHWD